MNQDLIILLPGQTSSGFLEIIQEAVEGYSGQMITRAIDIPSLQKKLKNGEFNIEGNQVIAL